jgi:hypothetical protein
MPRGATQKGSALFRNTSPALFSMTIGFVGIWLFSITDSSANAAREHAEFPAQQVRSETGYGASGHQSQYEARAQGLRFSAFQPGLCSVFLWSL